METFFVSPKQDNGPDKEISIKASAMLKDSRAVYFLRGEELIDIFPLSEIKHAGKTKLSPDDARFGPEDLSVRRLNEFLEKLPVDPQSTNSSNKSTELPKN